MRHIWHLGPCFIRDILNEMEEPRPPYTSLASVVKNLERKKYVTGKKFGMMTRYYAKIREENYKRTFMSDVVRNYFTGSYKNLVSFFVNDGTLSKGDLDDLIKEIEKSRK